MQSSTLSPVPRGAIVEEPGPAPHKPPRLASLDQYRGYAFFGMVLVNYLGEFDCMPWQFKHHEYGMSYADTIAPLFIFLVGMGFRASFARRITQEGVRPTVTAALRRYIVLIAIGIVLYGPAPDNWRYWWDALVDIGFGGILALPVMAYGLRARAGLAAAYLGVYQMIFSLAGYGAWTMQNSIDGGPLGVLPWAAILLSGTVAHDLVSRGDGKRLVPGFLAWGVVLCLAGWLLTLEWPGVKPAWPFSQRAMSIPYPLFSAGLCFLLYIPFHLLCDVKGWRIPHLTVLGMNPLVLYLVQQALGDMHGSLVVPGDSGPMLALVGFAVFYSICYAVGRKLHKDRIVIKL